MNTLLTSPRRLVLALVAAGALGATGAGLITAHEARAQLAMPRLRKSLRRTSP